MSIASPSVPKHMQVILADPPGGPQVMRLGQRDVPVPGAGEVLIRVAAAGVNGADLREREGKYPVPPGAPDIMGLEASGEVVAVGQTVNVFRWAIRFVHCRSVPPLGSMSRTSSVPGAVPSVRQSS